MAVWTSLPFSRIASSRRLDSEYFRPEYLAVEGELEAKASVPLSSLCDDVRYGLNVPPDYVEDGLRFIRALNLKENGLTGEVLSIPLAADEVGADNILEEGDILIVRSGANVGDAGFVGHRAVGATFGSYVIRIRTGKEQGIDSAYLYVYLKSRAGRLQTLRLRSGSAQPNISLPNLKELRVFVPSEGIQTRVRKLLYESISIRERGIGMLAEADAIISKSLGVADLGNSERISYPMRLADLKTANRFDAEYFKPRYQRLLDKLNGLSSGRKISSVIDTHIKRFNPLQTSDTSAFNYIEIGSLTENGTAEADLVDVGNAPSRAHWIVEPKDVIASLIRPMRRLSALVTEDQDGFVCSSGFAVLRCNGNGDGTEPEIMLTYLRMPLICELMDLYTTATMYPAIPVERLLSLPFPEVPKGARDKIIDLVRGSAASVVKSHDIFESAKSTVDAAVFE